MTLTLAEPAELSRALTAVLSGEGSAVAPLPTGPVERAAALEVLRVDLPLTEPDAAAVVVTSGSTGQPKGVVLSRAAIIASALATHERLGGAGDWLLALPSHYVAGFMVHARAVVGGTRVHDIGTDLGGLDGYRPHPERPTYVSLVATQLRRALAEPHTATRLARLDAVLLGGGPAPAGLLDAARAADIRVVTTYGMSETCGGCCYDGVPLPGVDVDIDPADSRVSISGEVVFSGYRLRPKQTAEVLVDGRLRTNDRARWRDGRLEVLGRLDQVVISGGLNVDLAAVEQAARAWADQRSATVAVVGVPDPEWGTTVVAVIDGMHPDLEGLRAELRRVLPPHAVPRRLVHRDVMPRTAGGKIDRHRLRSELAPAPGGVG